MKRYFTLLALTLLALSCAKEPESKPAFVWIEAAANFPCYGNSSENIQADCRRIAETGFTDIIVDVRPTSGDVLFKSEVAPGLEKIALWKEGGLRFVEREADFDYLRAFIDAGHEAGLRVHASVNVMVGGFLSPGTGAGGMVYENPERKAWCAVDLHKDGTLVNHADDDSTIGGRFLDPANPQVQEFLLTMLEELAAYKDLDGIVLDRCRYDDYAMDAGYTPAALEAFTDYLGHAPERWPVFSEPGHIFLDKEPDELEVQWLTFRCKIIRDFVEQARGRVKAVAPDMPFEIYVGAWFSEYYRSGVNWTSPAYDLAAQEPTFSWATPEYQATGFADLFDYMFLGAYTGADSVYGNEEKTMQGFAQLGRKRLCGAVPFASGPDIGNGKGFEAGGRQDAIEEFVPVMMQEADGLFIFDLCHIRMFDYWDAFREALTAPAER